MTPSGFEPATVESVEKYKMFYVKTKRSTIWTTYENTIKLRTNATQYLIRIDRTVSCTALMSSRGSTRTGPIILKVATTRRRVRLQALAPAPTRQDCLASAYSVSSWISVPVRTSWTRGKKSVALRRNHHHWHNSHFWAKVLFRSSCRLSLFLTVRPLLLWISEQYLFRSWLSASRPTPSNPGGPIGLLLSLGLRHGPIWHGRP